MKYYRKENEVYGYEDDVEVGKEYIEITKSEMLLLTTTAIKAVKIAPISMRQCRLMLLKMGLLEAIETDMTKDKALSIEWEYATEVAIDNPLVLMLSEKLGLSEEARIAMFEEARLL